MKAFQCFCLKSKNGVGVFYTEKRNESKEVIKRKKNENIEKALEKMIFKRHKD